MFLSVSGATSTPSTLYTFQVWLRLAPLYVLAADQRLDAVAEQCVAPNGGADPPAGEGRRGDDGRLIKVRVVTQAGGLVEEFQPALSKGVENVEPSRVFQ